nr:MAG TPA: hypothetical protein [Caudoviricetes sp.]
MAMTCIMIRTHYLRKSALKTSTNLQSMGEKFRWIFSHEAVFVMYYMRHNNEGKNHEYMMLLTA